MAPAQGGRYGRNQNSRKKTAGKKLLQHLLQLIVDELDLGSDDDLASVLARLDDTGSTGSLNGLVIDLCLLYTSDAADE